jgi:transcription initiation factor TFIIH subunit 3
VFINAHLAFNHANQVAVVASHSDKARWLYPAPPAPSATDSEAQNGGNPAEEDVEMLDSSPIQEAEPHSGPKLKLNFKRSHNQASTNASQAPVQDSGISTDAIKYRPFRAIEDILMTSTRSLISSTTPTTLINSTTTVLAGALTLALAYINKQTVLTSKTGDINPSSYGGTTATSQDLTSRILVVSVSSDSAVQYIPVMNSIFAAQRSRIPIDVLKLHDESTFLQQASDATDGIYIAPDTPEGLLQYLMMAFLPDQTSRKYLILPSQSNVDFRAACFCHKKVIDVGFVCSICLSSELSEYLESEKR